MSDELVKRLRGDWFGYEVSLKAIDAMEEAADRIYALTADRENRLADLQIIKAERNAAYASGYSDAEAEISKSALGQRNAFLHYQYANAADHIKALTAERDRLREALEQFLIEYDVVDLAHAEPSSLTEAVLAAREALKGESHE